MIFGWNPTDKFKFWAAAIATLVIVSAIFGWAWYTRSLQIDLKAAETERDAAEALAEYRSTIIDSRNNLIAAREKSAAANRAFLSRQAQSREALKNDAEVDPDILGPDYFNSLQRPR